jgi:hypothetical protein
MSAFSPGSPVIFRFIAPAFVGGALFHLAALVEPGIAEPVPAWYHLLFVVVNAALAVLVLVRPRGFVPLFALYMVQQYVEHLPRCIEVWRVHHRFDLPGFAPLVFVPFVLALLIRDARARSHRDPDAVRA